VPGLTGESRIRGSTARERLSGDVMILGQVETELRRDPAVLPVFTAGMFQPGRIVARWISGSACCLTFPSEDGPVL